MKSLIYIFFALTVSVTAQNQYKFEGQQFLKWTGKAAVGGYAPEGTVTVKTAKLSMDSGLIKDLVVQVDMTTIHHENDQLMNHLKEEDFFHISRYPIAEFRLQTPIQFQDSPLTLEGVMTIRGVSNTEQINATIRSVSETEVILSFNTTLDRTRYGVNYNSPSIFKKLKENAIKDTFTLSGNLVFKTD